MFQLFGVSCIRYAVVIQMTVRLCICKPASSHCQCQRLRLQQLHNGRMPANEKAGHSWSYEPVHGLISLPGNPKPSSPDKSQKLADTQRQLLPHNWTAKGLHTAKLEQASYIATPFPYRCDASADHKALPRYIASQNIGPGFFEDPEGYTMWGARSRILYAEAEKPQQVSEILEVWMTGHQVRSGLQPSMYIKTSRAYHPPITPLTRALQAHTTSAAGRLASSAQPRAQI